MSNSDEKILTPLQAIRNKRADRQAALAKAEEDQLVLDLTALDGFETELGDSNVACLKVPFTPGLPTMLIARKPTKAELARYRARIKPKREGKEAEKTPTEACEEVADVCVIYPAKEEDYERLCTERPGVRAQLGQVALKLIVDQDSDDAKK